MKVSPAPWLARLIDWSQRSRRRALGIALGLVLATGVADYLTGPVIVLSLFYVLPVLLATRAMGRWGGLAISVAAAGVWNLVDLLSGAGYGHWLEPAWNALMRLGILAMVAYILLALGSEMDEARSDFLTNLCNRRQFLRLLEAERNRSAHSGRPFSLAYLDIDRFKALNDTLGHETGDEALRAIAAVLQANSRSMDTPARLGGDEFAVLLPDAPQEVCARITERMRQAIEREIEHRGWPIGVSLGSATFHGNAVTVSDILRTADQRMYREKDAHRHHAP